MAFAASERFTLVDQDGLFLASPGDELDIREPFGFSDMIRNLKADDEYFGFNAEFGEGESQLGFDWVKATGATYSPHEMIQDIIENDGIDSTILLRYYRTIGGVEAVDYEWTLILKSADGIDDKVFVRVKKEDFGDKLRTRFDTVVDVESSVDLDDNANSALTLLELPLHSRKTEIEFNGNWLSDDLVVDLGTGGIASNNYVPVSPTNVLINELGVIPSYVEDYQNQPGLSFVAPYNGNYTFDIFLYVRNAFDSPSSRDQIEDLSVILEYGTNSVTATKVVTDVSASIKEATFTISQTVTINQFDEVNLNFFDTGVISGNSLAFEFIKNELSGSEVVPVSYYNISSLTTVNPSTTTGHFIYDVLNKSLEKITGQTPLTEIVRVALTMYNFATSQVVTGQTSGATGTISIISSNGLQYLVGSVTGIFQVGEFFDSSTARSTIEELSAWIILSAPATISSGDTIEGNTSGATGTVESYGFGIMTLSGVTGQFQVGESIIINAVPSSETITTSSIIIRRTEFQVGETVTGATSSDTGTILSVTTSREENIINVEVEDVDFTLDEYVSTPTASGRIQSRETTLGGGMLDSELAGRQENGYLTDGNASLNFITTGRKIRGLSSNSNLKVKASTLIDFLRARWAAGWQIIKDADGVRQVKVEKNWEFMESVNILTLYNVENPVRRQFNQDIIYNESEVGYQKFAKENEDGSIDGFNTIQERLHPIEKEKKKFSLIVPAVTDGAEIERIRRLKIKEDESDQSDDEIIIIKCQRINESLPLFDYHIGDFAPGTGSGFAITFNGSDDTITLGGLYLKGQIENASQITTTVASGGLDVSGTNTWDIDSVSFDAENNQTVITVTQNISSGTTGYYDYSIYFDIDIFIPERNASFASISGITDEYSEYNIDQAPSNFIIQWWHILGGSVTQKAGTKKVKFTSGKNSIALTKRYTDVNGNWSTSIITEGQDFLLSSLNSYNPPIITPFAWNLSCYISYDDWQLIRLALLGENTDSPSKNWGYLQFTDNFGNLVQIWPRSLKRNEKTGRVEIYGWERNQATAPPPPTFFWLQENGDYWLNEDGGRKLIEN